MANLIDLESIIKIGGFDNMSKNNPKISKTIIILLIVFLCTLLVLFCYFFKLSKTNNFLTYSISYSKLEDRINNEDSFNLLIYNNDLDESTLDDIIQKHSNLYIINIDNDIKEDYSSWINSEEGQRIFSEYKSQHCSNSCGGDFAEEYIERIKNNKKPEIKYCLTVIVQTEKECKESFYNNAGLKIYKYIRFIDLGFDKENAIYEINNGEIIKTTNYNEIK